MTGALISVFSFQGAYTNGVWEEQVEELNFASYKFCITHQWLKVQDEKSEKAREKETDQDDDDEGGFLLSSR